MKIDVFDINGKSVEQLTLSKEVFGIEPNKEVMAQYLRVYNANQRQGTSSTKTRGEVEGTGKKPWKQKGTGRARVGSSRTPLWRHGGITHGPKPKDWSLDLPKKIKKLAIVSSLSAKFASHNLKIVNKIDLEKPKTKEISTMLKALGVAGKTLLIMDARSESLLKSSANIKNLNTALVSNLNAYELLNAKNVLFLKDAILKVQEKYEAK